MIKYFAIENYRSIKKECVIDFDLNIPKNNPLPANTIIGFAGANASGKTTVLQALTFVYWFMQSSFLQLEPDEDIPCQSFYSLESEPTKFHLIFSKKGFFSKEQEEKFIDYEYILHLTKEKIIYEELNYYPYGRKRNVYTRALLEIKFGRQIRIFDTADLRSNSSIISFARQFKSQKIAIELSYYLLRSNITRQGLSEYKFNPFEISKLIEKDNELSNQLLKFIRVADVGIESIFLKEEKELEFEKILNTISRVTNNTDIREAIMQSKAVVKNEKEWFKLTIPLFKHKINQFYAEFSQELESAGTLQFLTILNKVLIALHAGMLLILDEIEIKLHQNLVAYLIGLFQNPSFNTKGAQLIFSFHNSYLMNILEPHQLWFTQKNDDGETEVFSANDFKDISKFGKEHLEELYRIGRFGAIPRGI